MKKAAIAIAIFGVVVFAILVYIKRDPVVTFTKDSPEKVALANLDSDSDGLADWEEILWQTNPNKADTDGDGTNDGVEVKQNRDPSIAGPNDIIKIVESDANIPTTTPYKYSFDSKLGSTLTDNIGLNLVSNYLEAKSTGSYTNEVGSEIVGKLVNTVDNAGIYTDIALADLNVAPKTTSKEELDKYSSELYRAIGFSLKDGGNIQEAIILSRATKTGDYSNMEVLNTYINNYNKSKSSLLEIRVPANFATFHLSFVQAFATVARSLTDIRDKAANDPIVAIRELNRYALAMNQIHDAYIIGDRLATLYYKDFAIYE